MLLRGIRNNRDPTPSHVTRTVDLEEIFRRTAEGQREVNAKRAATLSPVAAAHRIYTDSIASMPWMVRQKEGNIRREVSHPIEQVLKHQANAYMTPYSAFKAQASQAFWYGTGFLYIRRGESGSVEELIPLPSEGHERRIDPQSGQVWYIFRVQGDDGKTIERKFQPSELWIKHFETYDGIHGVGMLDMAKDAMETDLMAQQFSKKFYTNGARPSGIVTVEAELEEESKDIVRRDFEKMAGGMDNAFRTAVLDMGMKYTPLGISQRDSQFMESREFSVDEIARFTGIPQYMLQAGKQTYESNEQQRLDFVITTLVPHIIRDEQEGTMKLLRREDVEKGIFLKRNEMGLLRGDDKSRMEYYRGMWEIGVLCGDDIRAKEDLSPLPDGSGEHFFVSKNYDTIARIISGGGEKNGNQT